MKRIHIFWLLLISSLFIITCKKSADKVFDGSSRIRGVVFFNNYLTGTQDTAKTAIITMTNDKNIPYVQNLTNGTFDIQSLSSGTFTFNVKFDYKQPGSGKTDHYIGTLMEALAKNDFKDQQRIILNIDSTGTATLQVQVVDSTGVIISNAQVCLYNNSTTLAANRGSCSGSLNSVMTNADGNAVFTGLQLGNYFVAVNTTAGVTILNNSATDQSAIAVSSSVHINPAKVTVKPTGNAFQLTLYDAAGGPLPNANVCLYTDTTLLSKYRGTCNGSVRSGTSNNQGIVVFSNLANVTYYASAYVGAGTDTLSNKTTDTKQMLTANTTTVKNYPVTLLRNVKPVPTTLTVIVQDKGGANVPKTAVCLYTDPTLLAKYRGTCNGSILSDTTGTNGSFTFTGIQHITYYISAYKVVGTDTLSNKSTDMTPIIPTLKQANTTTVVIKP